MGKKRQGPEEFDGHYAAELGERWAVLKAACALENQHFGLDEGLSRTYWLDEASVLAGRWVEARPGERVLDMCAAPGGKSLVIAQDLFGLRHHGGVPGEDAGAGELVTNELSGTRRDRLQRVIRDHLPEAAAARTRVYGHDATRWGVHEPDAYDAILLDAPCSSERHLIQDHKHLEDWSPRRSERLAQQAYVLLLSAAQALRMGGRVVYCTCAISMGENDMVVERVLERLEKKQEQNGWKLRLALPSPERSDLRPEWMETCSNGCRVLPDMADGRGPLYLSRLIKVPL